MIDLRGKLVEVIANDITYTGTLVEISETDVYLESESGWIVIPVEQVASISEKWAYTHSDIPITGELPISHILNLEFEVDKQRNSITV